MIAHDKALEAIVPELFKNITGSYLHDGSDLDEAVLQEARGGAAASLAALCHLEGLAVIGGKLVELEPVNLWDFLGGEKERLDVVGYRVVGSRLDAATPRRGPAADDAVGDDGGASDPSQSTGHQ